MNDVNDSFVCYGSWWSNIHEIYGDEPDVCEKLIYAINKYGFTGEKTYPCEKMFLMQCYSQIDSAQKKWEDIRQKRSEAGKKGGAPKGNQNAKKTSKNNQNNQELEKTSKNNHSNSTSVSTSVSNSNNNSTSNNTSSVDSLNAITSEVEDDDDVWGEGYGEPV